MNSYSIDLPGSQEAGEPVFVTFTLTEEHQLSLTAKIIRCGKHIRRVVTRERSLTVGPSLGDMLLAAEDESGQRQEANEVDRRRRFSRIRCLEENVRRYISRHSSNSLFQKYFPEFRQTMLMNRLTAMLPTATKVPSWEEIGQASAVAQDLFGPYCKAVEKKTLIWL
jgi:hypothetical protein